MKKTCTFLLGVLLLSTSMVMGQKTTTLYWTATAPVIDGVFDALYDGASKNLIDTKLLTEVPVLKESYWKGVWTDDGLYICVFANDDNWDPKFAATDGQWMRDYIEIYMDVNAELNDGVGPNGQAGHYQIQYEFKEVELDGTPTVVEEDSVFAIVLDDPAYTAEYFIPFAGKVDMDDAAYQTHLPFGFDVMIIDYEAEGRNRMMWSLDGSQYPEDLANKEPWFNMDGAGVVTLLNTTGVNNFFVGNNFTFQNPVSNGKLNVSFNCIIENGSVQIFDLVGKVVSQSNINSNNSLTVDVNNIRKGIYILKVNNGNKSVAKKFVIN